MMQQDEPIRIAVIGAGIMGHGIALEFAANGCEVTITDVSQEALDTGMTNIRESLRQLMAEGRSYEDPPVAIMARIHPTLSLTECVQQADIVVEAVAEVLEVKQQLFREIDLACPPHAILASNTSSFMPSQLASATFRPSKVLVTHYFNPPHFVPLVEVVRGPQTHSGVVNAMVELYRSMGKVPVVVEKETLGFIGNRLQKALFREACALVDEGVASVEDVDTVIRTSIGRRWSEAGVFEVFDLAGLDTVGRVYEALVPDLDDSTNLPEVLQKLLDAGHLGVKSGQGFYEWTPERLADTRARIRKALMA